jgi:hypothetical protein
MKSRAAWRTAAISLILILPAVQVFAAAPENPLPWLNSARNAEGVVALGVDPLLMKTAEDFARTLAGLGRISHTGPDGSDALTRYLRNGGTSAKVGEIIGAGEGLLRIEAAWLSSPDHRSALLKAFWTHAGWGMALAGTQQVWVILFVQKRTAGLEVKEDGQGGLWIGGAFLPLDVGTPLLISGIDELPAAFWDPALKRFTFLLPASLRTGYIRLGYISMNGGLVVTDVITSPRETESPAGGSRF